MGRQHPIFTEEHEMLRRSVRSFLQKEIAPHADEWDRRGGFPHRELFKRFGELGFLGLNIPEEYGGAGGDFVSTIVYGEEMGACNVAGVSASIGMHATIVLPYLSMLGTEEQKQKYLVPGVRGEVIGCLGVTEPNAGSDVGSIRTSAVLDGDSYVINGSKIFITNGGIADFIILAAKTDKEKGHAGISLFLVDTNLPGFTVSRDLDKLGWRSGNTAELAFEDVRVPRSALFGEENMGFYQIMIHFQEERLYMAIGAVCEAQKALDLAIEYSKDRVQFGRPIAKFQVTRHKIADMATEIEAARQLVYNTIRMHIEQEPCNVEVAMCKLFACEMSNRVINQSLQLFGGYGYMMEYPIQRLWRDSRIGPIGGGTSEIQREIIGRLLLQ
ncbi:MAG: acyl-CoA dehydrogenase [Candidatus Abyssobacteria bacterium SURF_5]|uniref:Cyclohexane-1-carbonyl-CoA dehydrogenase n=1 Tax=Abyssobacteria bacterium (strain SURF_5) TaxID=2093360 RepID=A0A3A4NJ43_ABYX5|nr:MAG: acyl-CoA dehydrogenase [Candidatus Abyssubacteria bacterium SURF_5]